MRSVGYRWHLRTIMAANGMFATTDLAPKLAERGIELHPTQVYRLVTGTPERLNLQVLAALCDILNVAPGDLIEPYAHPATATRRKAAGDTNPVTNPATKPATGSSATTGPSSRPKRARIVAHEPDADTDTATDTGPGPSSSRGTGRRDDPAGQR